MRQSQANKFTLVSVTDVGFADDGGVEGLIWLKSKDRRMFAMRAFSGEVAMHMKRFLDGDRSSIPSVFNIIEALAESQGLHLAGVEVYPSGEVLRSDMQFLGKGKNMMLGGYRASDGIAMALFYDAPIMLHDSLLEAEPTEDSQK